jgi:hypothetical protein
LRTLSLAVTSLEVCPIGGDQRFTSIWQNERELQAPRHAGMPKNLQRLSLKRMMLTGNGHSFRKVLMMGSVWRFPSTKSTGAF